MSIQDQDKSFDAAATLIKIIAIVIAVMVMIISKYAFIFFVAVMLPAIFAIFFDKNTHKCLSATICSFNLIGVMPYLVRIWQSSSVDLAAKETLANVSNWVIIYGAVFIGQLVYLSLPSLFVKLYAARNHVQIHKLRKQQQEIRDQWGIETEQSR